MLPSQEVGRTDRRGAASRLSSLVTDQLGDCDVQLGYKLTGAASPLLSQAAVPVSWLENWVRVGKISDNVPGEGESKEAV